MSPIIPFQKTFGISYQASKWQVSHVLIDVHEMEDLLDALENFWIVQISGLVPVGQEIIRREEFISAYSSYIAALKRGELPNDHRLRSYFSSVFTVDLNAVYAVKVNPQYSIVKIRTPVVQLQSHRFDYSVADGKFRSMVLGQDSIHWGLQFSYPHLYQDEDFQVFTVREDAHFPNTSLFKKLQRWIRSHTIATPFEVGGKRINVPVRLGKQCVSWINGHPQFSGKHLRVAAV